jgi:hypothetical protein
MRIRKVKDNSNSNKEEDSSNQAKGSQMVGQVLESVTDKNMSTTIDFRSLEVDIPRARGPGGERFRKCQMDSKRESIVDYRAT